MKVFPAVDILKGRCVQLVQGKRETATFFGKPLDCAMRWMNAGARELHVVNLDGAFGNSSENLALIRGIVSQTGLAVQLGGGIRSFDDAAGWLDAGIERVIIGTLAVKDPAMLTRLSDVFGRKRIMAGVDARNGMIAVEGWERTGGDYIGWARTFEEKGAGSLLFTNVDIEGLQQGICTGPVIEAHRLCKDTRRSGRRYLERGGCESIKGDRGIWSSTWISTLFREADAQGSPGGCR